MKKTNLALFLTEKDGFVALKVTNEGKSILDFRNDLAPTVCVRGYKQPILTREQLIEIAQREAYSHHDGALGILRQYSQFREMDIYKYTLELRKIMRKIVKAASSANAAKLAANELAIVGSGKAVSD